MPRTRRGRRPKAWSPSSSSGSASMPTVEVWTSNTTWVAPDGAGQITIEGVGGGGGGAGISATKSMGGGGGGGAYTKNVYTVVVGNSYAIAVTATNSGQGGAGGANGNNGADASFKDGATTIVLAKGGANGQQGGSNNGVG